MVKYKQETGIKSWAEADRPREKLMIQGRRQLTDAELLAILVRSGNRNENAVGLSKRILGKYNDDLYLLGQASLADLAQFKGIGEAKAICIMAALELGRRRKELPVKKAVKIISSRDIYELLLPVFADLRHEEFWIVLLNRANFLISMIQISKGGQAGTVADPKIIFKHALDQHAAFIVLAHNHPSGNLKPSAEDINITKRMVSAGKMLDLNVIDHLIMTNKSFCSLCDEGVI